MESIMKRSMHHRKRKKMRHAGTLVTVASMSLGSQNASFHWSVGAMM
jgi:hypothetical protein